MTELHYITPIANLRSIMERGILSHRHATMVDHISIADANVQNRRKGKRISKGLMLHEYANVYFDARNPMMYKRRIHQAQIVVIRINPDILDIPGTVIADGNAAADATRFDPSPGGLVKLDEERVYATWWTDPDPWAYFEKKRQRCAEVLVPGVIPSEFLTGCYACENGVLRHCRTAAPELAVEVNSYVFFC
ncbi:MAG TPA: DUF4433 domain-containing protein [Mycobacteriales bacterium]|nr:DUF4433 domain-containing protein [Mycobacteriales bacterium]